LPPNITFGCFEEDDMPCRFFPSKTISTFVLPLLAVDFLSTASLCTSH
jgi:hypothetical protein